MTTRKRALFLQYGNPGSLPPILSAVRILSRGGWEICALGIRHFDLDAIKLPELANTRWSLAPACGPGLLQKIHFLGVCLWAGWRAIAWRPSVIYVSDPMAAPMGWLAGAMSRIPVVYHEHDSPDASRPAGTFMRIIHRARSALAQSSVACILPNRERAELFRAEMRLPPDRILCVWNCPMAGEVAASPAGRPARGKLLLYYHGSINRFRVPLSIVDAMKLLPSNVGLRVVGHETVGSRGHIASLIRAAREAGVQDRIEWVGYVPRIDLLGRQAGPSIGLALMPMQTGDINLKHMVGASNKAFEYMAMGMPLLVSRLADWEETFVKPGYAKSCDPDSPSSIARSVEDFLQDPDGFVEMGSAGRERIRAEWNYEEQFKPVHRLLELTASGRKPT
jgi:glycosyltransferase involved in cell wall biosynthesis